MGSIFMDIEGAHMFKQIGFLFLSIITLSSSTQSSAQSSTHASNHDRLKVSIEVINTSRTRLNSVEEMTRNAAVKVIQPETQAFGSGTYFKLSGSYVIITASHVVQNIKELHVVGLAGETVVGTVFYNDPKADIAMLRVDEIRSRRPAKFKYQKGHPNLIGSSITYSGYPNDRDLLTLRGSIAGLETSEDSLLAQSYAWMGASGSGVFDRKNGNFIGVLSAVDVGVGFYPQIIESIVWISPAWKINREEVRKNLEKLEQEIKTKASGKK